MTSTIFDGITWRTSALTAALTGALALVATLAVLLVSGASAANAQSSEVPSLQQLQVKVCTFLRSLPAINESPSGTNPLSELIEHLCGPGTVAE